MFGLPADSAWIWLGLVVGTAAMFGMIADVQTAPPAAEPVADAIDDVAASDHTAAGSVEIRAAEIKLERTRIGLRNPGGTSHATIRYGPVTPVEPGSRLDAVLDGRPPEAEFAIPGSFEYSLAHARNREAEWQHAGPVLRIRKVQYGEVTSVLVGT